MPDSVHPDFYPRNFGSLAEDKEQYRDYILDNTNGGIVKQSARNMPMGYILYSTLKG
ncbi:hypothetical protein BDV12DRAFT_178111 [Aspergillus spectabilis]